MVISRSQNDDIEILKWQKLLELIGVAWTRRRIATLLVMTIPSLNRQHSAVKILATSRTMSVGLSLFSHMPSLATEFWQVAMEKSVNKPRIFCLHTGRKILAGEALLVAMTCGKWLVHCSSLEMIELIFFIFSFLLICHKVWREKLEWFKGCKSISNNHRILVCIGIMLRKGAPTAQE